MPAKPRIVDEADGLDVLDGPPPSKLISLSPAIEWPGGTVDALELREPTVLEYLRAQSEVRTTGGGPDQYTKFQLMLICSVTGRPRAVIEKLPVRVFREAWQYIEGFLEATPAETS